MPTQKKYSIIASDFDDTLLRSDDTISDFTRRTISDFTSRGGTFLISTGRMYRSALAQAKDLGLTGYLISYQGGMVNDIESGEQLLHRPMSTEDALFNLKLMEEGGSGQIHVYNDDILYVKTRTEYTAMYERACGVTAVETHAALQEVVKEQAFTPTKLMMMDYPERCRALVDKLEVLYGDRYYYCLSKPTFFEVALKGVSKGSAVEYVAGLLGKTLGDVIAIGDSLNDLPMIQAAGLGVAVGNALEDVKAAADLVGKTNDEDAVADIILRYGI